MGVRIILLGVAAALCAGPALAQGSATATGSITILDPPALGKETEMTVAPVARPSGAGAVSAQGLAARYSVSGAAGDTFNIAMPSSLKLVRSGGTEEVMLTLTPSGAVRGLAGALGTRSSAAFGVEGQVTGVTGTAAAGTYQGAFQVIMALQ